ncbi:hypothetical protein F511_27885 [Dorcoceras hygrometricum]|uniref:Uncharacterized protein n=1 Tax=Dorcoceras hygrometricum TaxID=472368 RepID=A0A2Z7BD39_9LAMI|nr:hypothetical protein F511_27885 [Dorcoceras hygrometricum]
MRRVVNYHSSWARQQQVELFDASDCACVYTVKCVMRDTLNRAPETDLCNICFVFAQPLFIYIFAQHLIDLRFATTDQQFASAVVSSSTNSFQRLIVFFATETVSTAGPHSDFPKGKSGNISSDELTDCARSVDAKISRAERG